jgi:hypothetical protein
VIIRQIPSCRCRFELEELDTEGAAAKLGGGI